MTREELFDDLVDDYQSKDRYLMEIVDDIFNYFESKILELETANTDLHNELIKIESNEDKVLYQKWLSMKNRCFKEESKYYHRYGGRGITIHDEWVNDYMKYEKYVLSLPNALRNRYSIDRIDNDGNYEPNNLRWADGSTQAQNTAKLQRNNNTGFRGVSKSYKLADGTQMYQSRIAVNGINVNLGNFDNEKDAGMAYDKYVIEHNLHHTLNFIETKKEQLHTCESCKYYIEGGCGNIIVNCVFPLPIDFGCNKWTAKDD